MDNIRIGIRNYEEIDLGETSNSPGTMTVINLYSEPLVRLYDGKIWPALAQSWQSFDDGNRWLFYLRQNLLFHDGTPCTVVDVMDSLEQVRNGIGQNGTNNLYEKAFSQLQFNIINRLTLEVICENPNGDVAELLSGINIRKKNRSGEPVIGTGNYCFASFYAGRTVRLTKKPGLKQLSAYNQITFHIIPDAQERYSALHEGKIHFAAGLEQLETIPPDNSFSWWRCSSAHSTVGLLNCFSGSMKTNEARLGLNHAIDVNQIVREVMNDLAVPAATVGSPYHCGFDSSVLPIPYDIEKAKRLFDGVSMPSQIVLTRSENMPDRAKQISEMISYQLGMLGIRVHENVMADQKEFEHCIEKQQIGDVALYNMKSPSLYTILQGSVSSEKKGKWWQGFSDSETEKLIKQANSEDDITERERKYSMVLKRLNQNPPWLYLFHPVSVYACDPKIDDVELLHTEMLRFPGSW